MIPKPVVSWSTLASNVRLASGLYRYSFEVNPLDPNEPGSFPTILEVGDWFIDYTGYPFLIEEVNNNTITVYDVSERGNGITNAYGPYNNKIGYIYRPLEGAFILTQAQLRKLDPSAIDIIQNIEKGILWKYRGIKIKSNDDILNVTNIELENAEIVDINNDGWQGGKKVKLKLPSNNVYTRINLVSHGFDGDVVYYDSITKTWNKAIASNEETCGSHFAVKIDDNNFVIINNGSYTVNILDEENNPLVSGEYYFLSQTIPGKLTKNQPENGIVQYILQSLEDNLVEINVEEPYEKGNSGTSSEINTFIELSDTPNSYEENKFLYTTINGIVFKSPLITDITDLEGILNSKVGLSSDNTLTGINIFNNSVYLNSNLYLGGIQEGIKSKILYYDPISGLISYGDISGTGGTPASPIKSIQFNNNGNFGATNFYYDPIEDKYGVFVDPVSSDSLFTIDTQDRGENDYFDISYFNVKGYKYFGDYNSDTIFEVNPRGIGVDCIHPINNDIIYFFNSNSTYYKIEFNTSIRNIRLNSLNLNDPYNLSPPGVTIGNTVNVFKTALYPVGYSNDSLDLTYFLSTKYTYYEGKLVVIVLRDTGNELYTSRFCFYRKSDNSIAVEFRQQDDHEYSYSYFSNLSLIYGINLHVVELTTLNTYHIYLSMGQSSVSYTGIKAIIDLNCYDFGTQYLISMPQY